VEEDGPGDVDPEEEEEQGAQSAVDAGVGAVVEDVKKKAAFGQIPDDRSDEGTDQRGAGRDAAPRGELVGDVKKQPDEEIGKDQIDMESPGDAHRFHVGLDLGGEPKGTPQHQGQKEEEEKVGTYGAQGGAFRGFEDVIDDVIVVFEKEYRRHDDVADTDVAQPVGIGDEGVDVLHDEVGVGRDQVFGDEFM